MSRTINIIFQMKPIIYTKKRKHPEDDLQMAVTKLLDSISLFKNKWCHVENERKCTPQQGARRKKKGVKEGVQDVLIFKKFECCGSSHAGLAIELKIGRNKPTKHQDDWNISLTEEGWIVPTLHSIDEVMNSISYYYGIKF